MPNSKRLTPEASEEERDSPRNPTANNNDTEGAQESSPPVAAGRRDENSISFRHFLQLQSDVVPSRHRSPRGGNPGAVDLVDVTMALPDFVQDHLVVESLSSGDHQNPGSHSNLSSSPLDLSVLNEILPDYSASQRNQGVMTNGHRRRNFDDNGLNGSNGDVSLVQGQAAALPDFLSDGPMHCSNNENLTASPSSSRGISCRSSNLTSDSRIDDSHRSASFDSDNSQHHQIERLRRESAEKSRRVNQLEAELSRLREDTESLLRAAEQRVTDANMRAADAERQLVLLNRENAQLKDQLSESSSQSQRSDSNVPADLNSLPGSSNTVTNGPVNLAGTRNMNANEVLNFTRRSETLVSQLLNCIVDLKTAAASSLEEDTEPEAKRKKDSSENL